MPFKIDYKKTTKNKDSSFKSLSNFQNSLTKTKNDNSFGYIHITSNRSTKNDNVFKINDCLTFS